MAISGGSKPGPAHVCAGTTKWSSSFHEESQSLFWSLPSVVFKGGDIKMGGKKQRRLRRLKELTRMLL